VIALGWAARMSVAGTYMYLAWNDSWVALSLLPPLVVLTAEWLSATRGRPQSRHRRRS
jgi:hypothetical protein